MKYANPVIAGFYPDPSICRAGQDYYLVTSSFEYFPGIPLFHSRDLIHWRQIGYCLTRNSQLSLEHAPSSGGIYAPTIRYNDGVFYVICTNHSGGGNFYVYTTDPFSDWSEPVFIDQGGIDPSLFFDEGGKVYMVSTGPNQSGIIQSEIDIKTGRRLTEPKLIWSGTGGSWPEAPHMYKIGGLYYLMIAEGGTEYGHMVTIARSNNPWGPFDGCPFNPILTHRSSTEPIQATGHGDLIQAHNGTWWMVFLGIRINGHPYCHHMGRETFLAPVKWTDDGWPVVGDNGRVYLEMEADDCLPLHPWDGESVRDDFNSTTLRHCWSFLRNPRPDNWSLTARPGWLFLLGSKVTLNDEDSPAFVGRRQRDFCFTASSLVDFSPQRESEEAGLTVYMNGSHHYEIALQYIDGRRCIILRKRIGELSKIVAQGRIPHGDVTMKIDANRDMYYFSYGIGGQNFRILGRGETRYLSTEITGGFNGVFIGMYATGNGRRSVSPAYFDWFEYVPLSEKEAQLPILERIEKDKIAVT